MTIRDVLILLVLWLGAAAYVLWSSTVLRVYPGELPVENARSSVFHLPALTHGRYFINFLIDHDYTNRDAATEQGERFRDAMYARPMTVRIDVDGVFGRRVFSYEGAVSRDTWILSVSGANQADRRWRLWGWTVAFVANPLERYRLSVSVQDEAGLLEGRGFEVMLLALKGDDGLYGFYQFILLFGALLVLIVILGGQKVRKLRGGKRQ